MADRSGDVVRADRLQTCRARSAIARHRGHVPQARDLAQHGVGLDRSTASSMLSGHSRLASRTVASTQACRGVVTARSAAATLESPMWSDGPSATPGIVAGSIYAFMRSSSGHCGRSAMAGLLEGRPRGRFAHDVPRGPPDESPLSIKAHSKRPYETSARIPCALLSTPGLGDVIRAVSGSKLRW